MTAIQFSSEASQRQKKVKDMTPKGKKCFLRTSTPNQGLRTPYSMVCLPWELTSSAVNFQGQHTKYILSKYFF